MERPIISALYQMVCLVRRVTGLSEERKCALVVGCAVWFFFTAIASIHFPWYLAILLFPIVVLIVCLYIYLFVLMGTFLSDIADWIEAQYNNLPKP